MLWLCMSPCVCTPLQAALADDPPTYWPERSYKWGTAEAFNPDHSDLLFLRWELEDAASLQAGALVVLFPLWR